MKRIVLGVLVASLVPAAAFAQKCPNVVIVLDRSGSMSWEPDDTPYPSQYSDYSCASNSDCTGGSHVCYQAAGYCGGPNSKIVIAQSVLSQVLQQANPNIRFGFTYFPQPDNPQNDQQYCQASQASPLPIEAGYGTTSSITTKLNNLQPSGSTPTGESLTAVKSDGSLTDSTRPRYVLLVTDGEPTCGNDPTGEAVSSVQALYSAGVKTFVVGFGAGTDGSTVLDDMAQAGHAPLPDGGTVQHYFQASDANALASTLSSIIQTAGGGELGGTQSCDPCLDTQCPSGQTCDSSSGAAVCKADPYAACEGATCLDNTFCRVDANGQPQCTAVCETKCAAGQVCDDGTCVDDPCAGGACDTCASGEVHDGTSTACVANQCGHITCPENLFCSNNACQPLLASNSGSTSGTSGATSAGTTGGSSGSTGRGTNGGVTASGCSSSSEAPFSVILLGLGAAVLARRRKA